MTKIKGKQYIIFDALDIDPFRETQDVYLFMDGVLQHTIIIPLQKLREYISVLKTEGYTMMDYNAYYQRYCKLKKKDIQKYKQEMIKWDLERDRKIIKNQ